MGTQVGTLIEPAIKLILKVDLVRERAPRLETRLHVALQALDNALSLRIARLTKAPADPQGPAQGGKRLGGPPGPGMQGTLPIPHQRPRQAAQTPQAARDPSEDVRR